ncbi:unnamed protein product, partial [Amoebophrya sp. A120]
LWCESGTKSLFTCNSAKMQDPKEVFGISSPSGRRWAELLADRSYERRKQAANEIATVVVTSAVSSDGVDAGAEGRVKTRLSFREEAVAFLLRCCQQQPASVVSLEYSLDPVRSELFLADQRKGALVALATLAIRDDGPTSTENKTISSRQLLYYDETLLRIVLNPVLFSLQHDTEESVRGFAAEALFNLLRKFRARTLFFFTEMFRAVMNMLVVGSSSSSYTSGAGPSHHLASGGSGQQQLSSSHPPTSAGGPPSSAEMLRMSFTPGLGNLGDAVHTTSSASNANSLGAHLDKLLRDIVFEEGDAMYARCRQVVLDVMQEQWSGGAAPPRSPDFLVRWVHVLAMHTSQRLKASARKRGRDDVRGPRDRSTSKDAEAFANSDQFISSDHHVPPFAGALPSLIPCIAPLVPLQEHCVSSSSLNSVLALFYHACPELVRTEGCNFLRDLVPVLLAYLDAVAENAKLIFQIEDYEDEDLHDFGMDNDVSSTPASTLKMKPVTKLEVQPWVTAEIRRRLLHAQQLPPVARGLFQEEGQAGGG